MEFAHLRKAKELLDSQGTDACFYACLELRKTIEEVVFRKLEFYSKRHGTKLLFTNWQPDKAIKILCQIEHYADKSYELRVAQENKDSSSPSRWALVGKHEALSSAWVRKNYQKLGSFLHYQENSTVDEIVLRDYLYAVTKELERIESGTLISNFAVTVTFLCECCESKIVCCAKSLPGLKEIVCPSDICDATYFAEENDGKWKIARHVTKFGCRDCATEISLLTSRLKIGVQFKCPKCSAKHQIFNMQWGYGLSTT